MGIIRKALLISTGGLAGLVLPKQDAPRSSEAGRSATKPKAKGARARARSARPTTPPAAKHAMKKRAPRRKPQATPSRIGAASQRHGTAHDLERIANLNREGALSEMEFAAAKAKILGMEMKPPEESQAPAFPAVEASITAARGLGAIAGDGGLSGMPRERGI